MKKFDFDNPSFKGHCQAKQDLIIARHNDAMTQEEYIALLQEMPKHIRWSAGHSPSRARSEYQSLKNNYAFFGGPDDGKNS